MDKTIWILGAGSSIGHMKGKFPSILDFFSFAVDTGFLHVVSQMTEDKYNELDTYTRELWGKSIFEKNSKIDIEKLMTLLEIELSHQQSSKLYNIKECLFEIISNVLVELPKKNNVKESDYDLFISKLNPYDTIITFNWDLLLDDKLDRERILKKNQTTKSPQYFNLINELSAIGDNNKNNLFIQQPYSHYYADTGYYLKLHGSIDWFSCNNVSCRAFGKTFPILRFRTEMYCSECHERVNNILIPPVLYKDYQKYPFIYRLWNTAIKEIENIDNLVIWGYSFPPTDFYTTWLLKAKRYQINSITIINPDCIRKGKKVTWNYSYLKQIIDVFKPIIKDENIKFYENMEKFVNEVTIIDDYSLNNVRV